LVVKFVLFPLSKKAIQTQLKMKDLEKPMKDLREKHKDNPQELPQKTLALYREFGVNPFAGIFVISIQLPIVIALFLICARAGLPIINPDLLYSFVPAPGVIQTTFLGFIDLASNKSILIALLVFVTQFVQIRLSLPKQDMTLSGSSQAAQDF